MDALEAIRSRRSVRAFSDKPLNRETLRSLVDAGRLAATARNIQPWEFIVVTDRSMLKKIGEIAETGRFIAEAAVCIAVYCQDTKYYLEDGCAATQNILVAAAALGLGSCWVAGDKKPYCPQISQLLNVSPTYKLVSLIAVGHPAEKAGLHAAEKRKPDEVIHWERF
ncbi:MAG: nitroreductase family protein [Candidatus Omnitrophica bacterium]|nr:nitroreductase family protein [Candidatus Omnitrophota bacterium]